MQAVSGKASHLKVLLHVLFFLSGIAGVFIGQVLPILARGFALDDLRLGYFFPAQFAGSLTGTFITGWFARRGRLIDSAWIGGLLMAAGILGMNAGSYQGLLFAFLLNGLGIGLTLPSINLLIIEANPERSAAALSILNFFWGAGAIVAKPFVDLTAGETRITVTTAVVAGAIIIAAALIAALRPLSASREPELLPDPNAPQEPAIWSVPAAWAIAAFNFVHVGFESGMGGWLTTYAARMRGTDTGGGLFSPTFLYFLFFLTGRAAAPTFFRFLDENKMLFASLATILLGVVVTLAARDLTTLAIGSAIAGLGTSAVFPTNVSRFYRTFGSGAVRRATPLFLSGTLGGAAVTYLIGYVSSRFENLRSGMFVLLINVALLMVIQILLSLRRTSKPPGM